MILTEAVKGGRMQTFHNLDESKQEQIINAGMRVFAIHGYKKSYMSEIAHLAEVSKSTLFYHFKTKLDLYLFLLDTAMNEIMDSVNDESVYSEKDFFECVKIATEHKMQALRKRPSLMKFLTKFYFETVPEVEPYKLEYLAKSDQMRSRLVFEELDVSKFKETVDPKLVMDMLHKWTEGYMAILDKNADDKTDQEISEFYDQMIVDFLNILAMLRINFYKPEYL